MFRFLLSTLSIFVLVSSSILIAPASARSCPVRMPSTLLSLYRNSDAIYIGTYDKTEEGVATEESETYSVVTQNKFFTITSTLKGEPRKFVVLDDTEYRHKPRAVEPTEEEADGEDAHAADSEAEMSDEDKSEPDEEPAEQEEPELTLNGFPYRALKPGDSVLLFLDRVTETDESGSTDSEKDTESNSDPASTDEVHFELSDEPFGLKNLPADSIAAYEARIKELDGIFASKDPTYAQIVAWLVRCAEDPLTRWEGTYELEASFTALQWQEQRTEERAEHGIVEGGEAADASNRFETRDIGFAKALTDVQKQALTNTLLNRVSNESGRSLRPVAGDEQLVQLVGRWGDSKVAAGLLDQFAAQLEGTMSSGLMATISSILKDDELSSIAERYSQIQWEDGSALVADEDEEEDMEELAGAIAEDSVAGPEIEPTVAESDAGGEAVVEENESGKEKGESDVSSTPVKKKTYAEARTELLEQFKSRATELLIKQSRDKTAKVNH